MKPLTYLLSVVCLGAIALGGVWPLIAQQTGTLVFDLKSYTSDAKIPKKNQKELEHAGIRWGMLDNTLLIPLVNEKYVNAETPYLTRFGERKELELKAGQYTVSCIGYEFSSTSKDIGKVLSKSAFFNTDVVRFTILPGKTTTLEVSPIYEAETQHRLWVKFTMFMPDLKVHVAEDGQQAAGDVVITRRTDKSVAWDDYHGPLKF